uniref:telomere length and silencing protein 1 homolog n=1 Tax=Styela clava TaxID=7725 RepID=UPI001939386C|nr:telomere length and silencing protein 1 homolog [Styela clava]
MSSGKRRNIRRKRQESSDEDEDKSVVGIVEITREMQKIRKRQAGVNAVALATGAKMTNEQELLIENDPFKLGTGGLIDMRRVKDRNRDRTYEDTDRDVTNLGTTFSAETNRRDEDAELKIYIEKELQKRKGITNDDENKTSNIKSAEDQLFALPDHLKISVKNQSEEMLSNQMLSGIPEIDLGIEAKIKNIERTEDAKQKLIHEQLNRKKANSTSFVPTNMAVNYVQHRRYMCEDNDFAKKKEQKQEQELAPLVVGNTSRQPTVELMKKRENKDKASDDFHYDKFRKHARRF